MRKIHVVGGSIEYASWLNDLANPESNYKLVDNIEDSDICLFTGGADIDPSIYGKKAHPTTWSFYERDIAEIVAFNKAYELGKKMLGICRGSQFLTCMAGGILIQHSTHPYIHPVKTSDDQTIFVNSLHHQQAYIKDMPPEDVVLLGWAENLSPYHQGEGYDDKLDVEQEVEMIYFPRISALGIQSHPECVDEREPWAKEFLGYCRKLVDTYL